MDLGVFGFELNIDEQKFLEEGCNKNYESIIIFCKLILKEEKMKV